jgi:hypothetical protein
MRFQQALQLSNTHLASKNQRNKNVIDLDKKNGNQIWQDSIKTDKKLTNYQKFIFLDLREYIQKVIRKFLTK